MESPLSTEQLRNDLADLGVEAGMVLIVHSSLRSIGRVVGGAATVVRALLSVLGEQGTLVMPAATPDCADPARDGVPVFDAATTPTTMGAIAEAFRTWPGTVRSRHPLESVCARGAVAGLVVRDHPLAFSEGPGSPFAKMHELDARILLLGVGFNRCTALHFAESLVERRRTMTVRFPVERDGRRVWVEVQNVADDNETHFPIVGDRYIAAGRARRGLVGAAPSILCPMRDLVEFACRYFESALSGAR